MRIQRFDEHTPMPWANGRGTSYEMARDGGEVWNWRVAIAPIVEAGPFSVLPGVDRQLVVIDAAPLDLVIDGSRLDLRRGEVARFAGESLVDAELPEGPTRDLGLMIRRGVASGSMMVVSSGVATGRILVVIEESVVVVTGESVVLEAGDALVGDRNEQVEIVSGLICALEITS